jgi:DNA polymerase-3 subunit alpha
MDIDTDFSAHAREITIKYVKEKYGERSVANIMTKNRLAAKSALEYAPKLLGLEESGDKKKYISIYKSMRKLIGDEPNAKLVNYENELKAEFSGNETALTIIDYAMMIENYITSYGTHAAGIIISDGTDVENYIPLMKSNDDDGNEVFAVQADMVQCEGQLGFIKMDFLGLKNLNAITDAMHIITETKGIKIEPYNLPFETEVFQNIYAKGDTNFVFQVESDGMKGMLTRLNPTCFEDIILAISVYRPGPMDFIDDIIDCKNTGRKSPFVEKFPFLEPILSETYGFPVYQEQVMSIMTTAAGFDMGDADNVRRHMSKKHEEELAAVRPDFVTGCKETQNISEEDANWLFDQLMPFAKYGFNKSHAAAYALVSYITAWLKYHYKREYLCAIIGWQPDKTAQLVADCKASNITLYRPDINESKADYYPYKDGIIIGFKAIKGLKSAAEVLVADREKAGNFRSIEEIVEKTTIGASCVAKLINSGACDDFTINREISATDVVAYDDVWKKAKTKIEKISLLENQSYTNEKAENKRVLDLRKYQGELSILRDEMKGIIKKHVAPLSTEKRLLLEVDALGMWVTGNPLEDYDTANLMIINDIVNADEKANVKMAAIITDAKVIKTKKGDKMAFVTITDKDGESISGVCFPKTYEKYQNLIQSGTITKIIGHKDTDNNGEDQIVIDSFNVLDKQAKIILAVAPTIEDMCNIYNFAQGYKETDLTTGLFFRIYTQEMSDISQTEFTVSTDVVGRLTENGYDVKIVAM